MALFATLFAACSDDNPKTEDAKNLSVTTTISTRALKSTFVDNDEMAVYAKSSDDLGSGWYNKATGVSKATFSGGNWTLTPPVEMSESTAAIFAYYPFSAQVTNPAAVPVSTAAQIDYLYAGTSNMASASGSTVALSMRHAQANVRFNIAKLDYAGAAVLNSIKIANKSGKNAFSTEGTLNIATGVITPKTDASATFLLSDINMTASAQGWAEEMPAVMVIPFKPQAEGDILLVVTIDGTEYSINCPVLSDGYEAAKQYTFTFELSSAGLVLNREDLTVETWGDTANTVVGKTSVSFAITTTQANQVVTMPDMGTNPGIVTFGDGQEADYTPNLQHTYATPGKYQVGVRVKAKITRVKFTGMPEMSEIDLSRFGK